METKAMIGGTAKTAFPAYAGHLKDLVAEHLLIEDEPLLLALYYAPSSDSTDVYLVEVIEGFGMGEVSEEKEFFDFSVASTAAVPLPAEATLHMLFANREEWEAARTGPWRIFEELREAKADGHCQLLHQAVGETLFEDL